MDCSAFPSTTDDLRMCRTGQWIQSLDTNQPSCSFEPAEITKSRRFSGDSIPSPVTNLTNQLYNQHLNATPRRKLSLDTSGETVSDTSTTTPDKIASEKTSPRSDKACARESVEFSLDLSPIPSKSEFQFHNDDTDFTTSDQTREILRLQTDFSCLLPSSRLERSRVPRNLQLESDCASSGCAWSDEVQSPCFSTLSPAPSSVFTFNDEEASKDSAVFSADDNSNSCNSNNRSEFAIPSRVVPRPRSDKLSSSGGLSSAGLSRKFSDDEGYCEEVMLEALKEEPEIILPLGDKMETTDESGMNELLEGTLLSIPVPNRKKLSAVRKRSDPSDTSGRISSKRSPLKEINTQQPKTQVPPKRKSGLETVNCPLPGTKRPLQQTTLCNHWGNCQRQDSKRLKSVHSQIQFSVPEEQKPVENANSRFKGISRCFSETEVTCPNVAHPAHPYDDPQRVGDYSRSYSLPVIKAPKISDLKCIDADTLAGLLRKQFSDSVSSYRLIDCRYDYEYEGGHIIGAESSFKKENKIDTIFFGEENLSHRDVKARKRILIFYCEFSAKRGPTLARQVRAKDRSLNVYPNLHYPEIYLLEGGYKNFFASHELLCDPRGYMRMNDQKENIRLCKKRSKTWAGGSNGPDTSRRRPGLQKGLFV